MVKKAEGSIAPMVLRSCYAVSGNDIPDAGATMLHLACCYTGNCLKLLQVPIYLPTRYTSRPVLMLRTLLPGYMPAL